MTSSPSAPLQPGEPPNSRWSVWCITMADGPNGGDVNAAAELVLKVFGPPRGEIRTQLLDLAANFADSSAQGSVAYVRQFIDDHPGEDSGIVAADSRLAVAAFTEKLLAAS